MLLILEACSSETAVSKMEANSSSVSQASNRLTLKGRRMKKMQMVKTESLKWSRKAEKTKLMKKMPLMTTRKTIKKSSQATKLPTPKTTTTVRIRKAIRVTKMRMEAMVKKMHL